MIIFQYRYFHIQKPQCANKMFQFINKNRDRVHSMCIEDWMYQKIDLSRKTFLLTLKNSVKTITTLKTPPFSFMETIDLEEAKNRPLITQLDKAANILKHARALKQIHSEYLLK